LEKYPDSAIGINLKACNTFRLSDGRSAENELKPLLEIMAASPTKFENDLIHHNQVQSSASLNQTHQFRSEIAIVTSI
jgi:intraflagellar transport protein 56